VRRPDTSSASDGKPNSSEQHPGRKLLDKGQLSHLLSGQSVFSRLAGFRLPWHEVIVGNQSDKLQAMGMGILSFIRGRWTKADCSA